MKQMRRDAVMTHFEVLCGLKIVRKEASTPNLKKYVDWKRYGWILSSPNLRCSVDRNRCEKMLSSKLMCYVDWKGCDRKLSRPI
jgi:hypothetical protein